MEAVETQKKQLEDQNTALSVKISELERAIRSERNLKDKVYPQRYTTILQYIRSISAALYYYTILYPQVYPQRMYFCGYSSRLLYTLVV
jgi:hypothetical protein